MIVQIANTNCISRICISYKLQDNDKKKIKATQFHVKRMVIKKMGAQSGQHKLQGH